MKIIIPQALMSDPNILMLMLQADMQGVTKHTRYQGSKATALEFDLMGEADITRENWEMILNQLVLVGVRVENSTFFSPPVPKSTLDNKVPADWPQALKQDPDDPEKTITKEWQEWGRVDTFGEDNYITFSPAQNGNTFQHKTTHEELLAAIAKFGGYTTYGEYVAARSAHQAKMEEE